LPIGRYLGALVGILAILYALAFFTGDSPKPKLGLDLEGGTQVTLQAKTTDGKPPGSASLDQARQIIERRVNGLGVAEAEVVTQSPDRIVISVPPSRSRPSLGVHWAEAQVAAAAMPPKRTIIATSSAARVRRGPRVRGFRATDYFSGSVLGESDGVVGD